MTYASEVLADSPLGFYQVDEASGTTMVDSSGNGRDGTYAAGVTHPASLINGGVTALNGNAVVSTNIGTTAPLGAVTLEGWIQTTDTGADAIIGRTEAGGFGSAAAGAYRLWMNAGQIYLDIFDATFNLGARLNTSGTYNDGKIHHVVGTWIAGAAMVIYVDGVAVVSGTSGFFTMSGGGTPLYVGRMGTNFPFNGTLDQLAFYSTALSASRVKAHYLAGVISAIASGESNATATATVTGPPTTSGTATGSGESNATATATLILASSGTIQASAESGASVVGQAVNVTDTTNRAGGRVRLAHATASWTPDVVPAPVGTPVAWRVDVAQAFGTPSVGGTTEPYQPVYSVAAAFTPRQRHRVIVGGRDVTFFRGVMVPEPSYQLLEPLAYGPATLLFPQIRPAFERLGVGALSWCRKGAPVLIQRVDVETGAVVATDYKGLVVAPNLDGDSLRLEVGGEVTGRASMINRQIPLFTYQKDLGWHAYHALADIRIPFTPYLGPTTGIKLDIYGGMGWLDYLHDLCSKAQDQQGQWTIMPGTDGRYQLTRKDTTTVHATAYLDDTRVAGSLRSDMSEEPNRIFVTAVAPNGWRIRGAVFPGLVQGQIPPYPMADGSVMTPGTTDAMTSTGDGISVMILRLMVMRYLSDRDAPGGWDDDVSDAIRALRKDAGRVDTPNMNSSVWKDLFELSATGYSILSTRIEPIAQQTRVRPWNLTASGAVRSRNQAYDPSVPWVDANVDMGTGMDATHVHRWADAELAANQSSNWVGSIKVNTGGVIRGTHIPGHTITAADVMPVRDLRPGMNLWLPLFDGGTLVHIAAVTVSPDGGVELLVDTRARDAMKVWQIVQRNRASRKSPARRWLDEHRSSSMTKDSVIEWDAVGGTVPRIALTGKTWNVFPVVAGQEGTIGRLKMNLDSADAEYAVAIFGRKIGSRRLRQLVGNPLSASDKAKWSNETVRDTLTDQYLMLYAAGDDSSPCGYYPHSKGDDGAVLNGRWQDDAGFPYRTFGQPVLWVAIYPDRDTHLKAGQIMWNQLEAGS